MMHKLLPLLTVLLLFTACDPCDCDDCCVDSTLIEFQNNTNNALTMVWHDTWTISPPGFTANLPVTDTILVDPGETITLAGFIAPSTIGELWSFPFENDGDVSNFDSVQVFNGETLLNRFDNDDCTNNPLCESAYNRSERELSNSTETTFLYVYE